MSLRRIKNGFLRILNSLLGGIELVLLTIIPDRSVSTIWIIGPPRSGTTLLYQILVRRYKFAYISKFSAMFFKAPILTHLVANLLFDSGKRVVEFKSNYGKTANWLGPHEAGSFWYRWFPKGDYVYVSPDMFSQEQLKFFKKEIVGLSWVAKAPVLFKNVYNSMRIAPIVETFPNACFLVCRRAPIDTAQSILNARIKLYNDKSKWMSLPPKEIDDIREHPYWEQVVEQVYYTYQQIEADKQRYGADRFFDVDYERLCKDPLEVVQQMEHFFVQHNFTPEVRDGIPKQFPFSTGKQVEDEDYQRILQATTGLWQ